MDNHIFRSAIGGFNRQDVMEYIERSQKQAEESVAFLESQMEQLQKSEEEARSALAEYAQERDRLAGELEEMTAKYNNAKSNWESQAQAKESSRRDVVQRDQTIREMTEENQQLFHRVQELESHMDDLRRQKEQLAQLELDAHRRAEIVVETAQAKARTITEEAETKARIITMEAERNARNIVDNAQSTSQAIVQKSKLCMKDTVDDFDEVLGQFQTVSNRIAEGLRSLERTIGEFPVGLNELKKDLAGLYSQISAKDAEMRGLPVNQDRKDTEDERAGSDEKRAQ